MLHPVLKTLGAGFCSRCFVTGSCRVFINFRISGLKQYWLFSPLYFQAEWQFGGWRHYLVIKMGPGINKGSCHKYDQEGQSARKQINFWKKKKVYKNKLICAVFWCRSSITDPQLTETFVILIICRLWCCCQSINPSLLQVLKVRFQPVDDVRLAMPHCRWGRRNRCSVWFSCIATSSHMSCLRSQSAVQLCFGKLWVYVSILLINMYSVILWLFPVPSFRLLQGCKYFFLFFLNKQFCHIWREESRKAACACLFCKGNRFN